MKRSGPFSHRQKARNSDILAQLHQNKRNRSKQSASLSNSPFHFQLAKNSEAKPRQSSSTQIFSKSRRNQRTHCTATENERRVGGTYRRDPGEARLERGQGDGDRATESEARSGCARKEGNTEGLQRTMAKNEEFYKGG